MLPHHLPWYVVGPLIGLCPVVLYAVAHKHLDFNGTRPLLSLFLYCPLQYFQCGLPKRPYFGMAGATT